MDMSSLCEKACVKLHSFCRTELHILSCMLFHTGVNVREGECVRLYVSIISVCYCNYWCFY